MEITTELLPVTTVHDALSRAIEPDKVKVKLENGTYKAPPLEKKLAQDILAQHGVTLSSYLRWCIHGLVRDFAGPRLSEEITKACEPE